MIAFQVSRRRRSTYQRNKADPSWLCHFGVASLGRRHGKLHKDAISAPADGGLLHAPLVEDKDQRHFGMNEYDQFYVIKIDLSYVDDLDLFPGTWKALAFIVCDPHRMAGELALHKRFMQIVEHRNPFKGMVKERIDFYELNALYEEENNDVNPQFHYYSFLTKDSAFGGGLLLPFGILNRCWHGRGYIGFGGLVACRVFLVRNLKLREDCIIGCRLMSRNEILDW